jgi:hypothetical protein
MQDNLQKYKIAIVTQVHIQPSDEWIKSLASVGKNHTVIITDDSNGKVKLPAEFNVYDYARQKEELGEELDKEFEQFRHSSGSGNFGRWLAYKQGFDIIMVIDSDCIVPPDFVAKHLEALMSNSYGWENTLQNTNWFARGFPYHERMRKTILNVGLWENELDVNGRDRLKREHPPLSAGVVKQDIAHGMVPLCGMNFAMWSYALPAFLFLAGFTDGTERFGRHDDIWGGYIFQKIMQKNHDMITFGNPIVFHDTIVDAQEDADTEQALIKWEEDFYNIVDMAFEEIYEGSYDGLFKEFATKIEKYWDNESVIFRHMLPGIRFWVKAFELKK